MKFLKAAYSYIVLLMTYPDFFHRDKSILKDLCQRNGFAVLSRNVLSAKYLILVICFLYIDYGTRKLRTA